MIYTLGKRERLSSKKDIGRLLEKGHYGSVDGLKYCYAPASGESVNRILVSVPKKLFRRAVKRNLLKRRLRESYRLQKGLLEASGVDIMFIYASKEILPFSSISALVGDILKEINSRL